MKIKLIHEIVATTFHGTRCWLDPRVVYTLVMKGENGGMVIARHFPDGTDRYYLLSQAAVQEAVIYCD